MALVRRAAQGDETGLLAQAVCALGVFDGVHIGHRALIEKAAAFAHEVGRPCVIITFDRDPDELFAASTLKKLMANETRIAYLASLSVDSVYVLSFTRAFANLSPRDFLQTTFGACLPRAIYVGEDFRFGKNAAGSARDLSEWGCERGVSVTACKLVEAEGEPIKATRIRRLLSTGALDEANALLGHPYFIMGGVEHGRGEGSEMGFATANLSIPENEQVIKDGVYAGYASFDGRRYKAAISSGVSPTFESTHPASLEAHILDFSGDLYGKIIRLEFIEYLRPLIKFDEVSKLIETVERDIAHVKTSL